MLKIPKKNCDGNISKNSICQHISERLNWGNLALIGGLGLETKATKAALLFDCLATDRKIDS